MTTTLPADVTVLAVVVVRDGQLPAGAAETVAEAGGAALLAGSGTGQAADTLDVASRVWLLEVPSVAPAALAGTLAPALAGVDMVVLPASPDGRDLAPRLAVILGRPLLAGAVRCAPGEVEVTRLDDRLSVRVGVDGPVLVTLRPGHGGTLEPAGGPKPAQVSSLSLDVREIGWDAESVAVLQPEPGVVDLAEARRIVGGGAGLVPARADGAAVMRLLAEVGAAFGASAGATRVVTDAGWMSYDRQIGTTGVSVSPELYIAFGISGAAQHVGGLGAPEHVVSVNTDPSCPMTAMSDLGIVADAPAVLGELASRLGVAGSPDGPEDAARPAGTARPEGTAQRPEAAAQRPEGTGQRREGASHAG
ncbi:MAG: mycofactocin-associated electron transfer flavoprotein alpha subunit [Actinobacteria bacterium]|nr:mycofactocin-associated electron transfer flavoprotein alpha subunit [Actinomycetota bacterium]